MNHSKTKILYLNLFLSLALSSCKDAKYSFLDLVGGTNKIALEEKAIKNEFNKKQKELKEKEDKDKADRLAKEEADRIAAEKAAKDESDKLEKEDADRKSAQEKADRLEKEEADRIAAEKAAKDEADRLAKEEENKLNTNAPEGMVGVLHGSFDMGSDNGESDEKPIHKVILTYSFYIGKNEVLQNEYQDLIKKTPSQFKGDNMPVETVSWFDAIRYCNEKSKKENLPIAYNEVTGDLLDSSGNVTTDITLVKGYRLPTEAEWEYAAKGGRYSKGYKYSGSNEHDEVAWYEGNSDSKTNKIGTKKPNELGIYDMSGNVGEWCTDWYEDKYKFGVSSNPYISNNKLYSRSIRSGAWDTKTELIRISNRSLLEPETSLSSIGFRLCKIAD